MTGPPVVRFADLRRSPAELEREIDAVRRVAERGVYVLGPEVAALEADLARTSGTAHVVGVASGTDALSLGLTALGIGPGDEVIVPAFTAFATAAAVIDAGATPVLVDVEPHRPHLDLERARDAVTRRTRAAVLVHLYGAPADAAAWVAAFAPLGIEIVEDCAQAQGATLDDGRPVGSIGRFGALSFYPTKNLGGAGDGGAVLTDDPDLAERVRWWRNHGTDGQGPLHRVPARNSRLDEVQAALLRVRLEGLDHAVASRRATCARYREAFPADLDVDPIDHGPGGAPHLAVVRTTDPASVAEFLGRAAIESRRHYPIALIDQPGLRGRASGGDAPNARAWAASCLSLPLHPRLDTAEVDRVVLAVTDATRPR